MNVPETGGLARFYDPELGDSVFAYLERQGYDISERSVDGGRTPQTSRSVYFGEDVTDPCPMTVFGALDQVVILTPLLEDAELRSVAASLDFGDPEINDYIRKRYEV